MVVIPKGLHEMDIPKFRNHTGSQKFYSIYSFGNYYPHLTPNDKFFIF